MMDWIVVVILALGVFFHVVATFGILRLPDFYSRIHMVGKADTLGLALVLLAVGLHDGRAATLVKVGLVIALYFLANPLVAHALARSAYTSGVEPWTHSEDP